MDQRFPLCAAYLTRDLCTNSEGIVPHLSRLLLRCPITWTDPESQDESAFFGECEIGAGSPEKQLNGYGLRFTLIKNSDGLIVRHGMFDEGILIRGQKCTFEADGKVRY